MSGIPVYTSSPISAAKKPSGVTPQTTALPSQAQNPSEDPFTVPTQPHPNSTLTSASKASSSSYSLAKPGIAAFPAPTFSATQRYAPLQPTPTTQGESSGPPPPQPGAFPTPVKKSIPPPPKAGESYQAQQTPAPPQTASMPQPYPPQMSIPPPTAPFGGQQPRSSTSTTQNASSSYPVQLSSSGDGASRRSLEHPPGYQQNVYASDLTSEQRRAMEAANASRENSGGMGEQGEGVWDALGKMAQQAGAKIAETEASVWRSINKE
ncbi:hypothetical protein HYFRA_00007203 [Hymenoscyphus fraxineus]|uniref:Uncharacterized protein n=1 Tax=Hymenoscyphus fraxineus TaxID=746836 RepID=A0A9N9L066_9HELO|nr:hypothetical protein HYFRA_00007203 [Hymenoscyphus fraxineus]